MKTQRLDKISAYFPFVFSDKLDPRNIFTVGEQVMSEHLFAFHARSSFKHGFSKVISDIEFNHITNSVVVNVKEDISEANSNILDITVIYEGLKSSLNGTQHAPYTSILKSTECFADKKQIAIHFKQIPDNLRFLFTIPDFSIFDPAHLPISNENGDQATGPYQLVSATIDKVTLKINPAYPKKLRANEVENVDLIKYNSSQASTFIGEMNPQSQHMAYFFGYSLRPDDLAILRGKGYTVEQFPTEWFVYFGIKSNVPESVRLILSNFANNFREKKVEKVSLGARAYSIVPSDREFAITKEEYYSAQGGKCFEYDKDVRFKVSTLSTWAETPFFSEVIKSLKSDFKNVEIELLEPKEIRKLFSKEVDIILSPLGISHADPLSHLSFLENTLDGFDKIITKEEIAQLSIINNPEDFNKKIKDVEKMINRSGILVPIAHFPGIVAYRSDFIRDESISFSWGIQTWSFQIN